MSCVEIFMVFCISVSLIGLFMFFTLFKYFTEKNLRINQQEWDEYSKNMTDKEKLSIINDWLYEQKAKHHWHYLYIPNLRLGKVKEPKDEKICIHCKHFNKSKYDIPCAECNGGYYWEFDGEEWLSEEVNTDDN